MKHFLTFLPDAYLATKIPDMSGKNLTCGNPRLKQKKISNIHCGNAAKNAEMHKANGLAAVADTYGLYMFYMKS